MNRGACLFILFLVWVVPFGIIATLVATDPFHRSVTPLYHDASTHWWAGQDLYRGTGGMNYLPPFALLFSPFHALPVPMGDILWRALAVGLMASGLWRFSKAFFDDRALAAFTGCSLLVVPVCLASIRNGQANALFGALTLWGALSLSRQLWWRSAAWMGLALIVKPLGVVFMLLAPVLYPAMLVPVATSFLASLLFPFLFATPDYVIGQYHACATNLRACAAIRENRFADISGIVRAFGGDLPDLASKALRAGAGALFLALAFFGGRKASEPVRFLWLYTLTTGYLMLFNPMNEYNSYVILAPAMGMWAVWLMRVASTRPLGWLVAGLSLSLGILPTLLHPFFGNEAGLVWPPLATLLLLGSLTAYITQTGDPLQQSAGKGNIP